MWSTAAAEDGEGRTDDWRWTRRAGVGLTGERERVPIAAPATAAARALSLELVISASVTRRRPPRTDLEHLGRSPSFSPQSPHSLIT